MTFNNQREQKKKYPPKIWEREREREREPFVVRKNYAYNGRDSDKFIVRGCK